MNIIDPEFMSILKEATKDIGMIYFLDIHASVADISTIKLMVVKKPALMQAKDKLQDVLQRCFEEAGLSVSFHLEPYEKDNGIVIEFIIEELMDII